MIRFSSKSALTIAALAVFAAPLRAAVAPGGIPMIAPSFAILPVSAAMTPSPSVMPPAPLLSAPALPSLPVPISGPRRLDEYHLDWSFLDRGGDGLLPVKAPRSPAPKPLAPAGAAAPLVFAVIATKAAGDALFDEASLHFDVFLPVP